MKYAASFVAWSNSGKTGLITDLIGALKKRGYVIAALKKSHVPPDLDMKGKDTDRFFESGAEKVAYFSQESGFLRFRSSPAAEELENYFEDCDVLLMEGIRLPEYPCFELIGPENKSKGYKCKAEELAAYIWNGAGAQPENRQRIPVFEVNQIAQIIDFLEEVWNAK